MNNGFKPTILAKRRANFRYFLEKRLDIARMISSGVNKTPAASSLNSSMPNGKTHDVITFLLTVPVAAAVFVATGAVFTSLLVAVSFLFGGLMFGPDLDTVSRQYSRWSIFRFLWLPYRSFFKHRSRWSHGLIFGALIRVVYFMGAATIAAYIVVCSAEMLSDGRYASGADLVRGWESLGRAANTYLGEWGTVTVFAGTWLGAASHTLTDISGTYIKTGRVTEFF